ncbi:MAG: histidine triad nucleotide-binding protein [Actinomycetota bacterium]|nr:histidine triad nucleotide-binding protein [Actinomycetota bacterium]
MPTDCLFCRIVVGEVPATIVRDGERTLAFRDISPAAPTHVLVIPREHHPDVAALVAADPDLLVTVFSEAAAVARDEGVDTTGYRLVANTGRDGQQSVAHMHVHVLGGRSMGWPPG